MREHDDDTAMAHACAAAALSELLALVAPEGRTLDRLDAIDVLELVHGALVRLRDRAPGEPWRESIEHAIGRVDSAISLARRAPEAPPAAPEGPTTWAWGMAPRSGRRR